MDEKRLYLHYVISRHKNEGNIQILIRRWLALGYDLQVVMPRPIMRHILEKFGFAPSYESLPDHYEYPVEVWCRMGMKHEYDRIVCEPQIAG